MKVLVSVSSRHGSTLELAEAIRDALVLAHAEVDLRAPELVDDVAPYDAVVIGSGVYAGHWLAPARELIRRHLAELQRRPVWLFSSGPLGDKPIDPPADALELANLVGAVDHQVFAGRLDRSQLGFAERAIVGLVRAPEGDFRPWQAVVEWTQRIASTSRPERTLVGVG